MPQPSATLEISADELIAIANCMNVICNIVDLGSEFHSLLGADREKVGALHERLLALIDTNSSTMIIRARHRAD